MNEAAAPSARVRAKAPVRLDAVEMRLVRLPLVEPFETSLWRIDSRLIFLVRMDAEGQSGWGEVVATEAPDYSYETVETARLAIREWFAPLLLKEPVASLQDVASRMNVYRGHPMARAGLELAYTDLVARLRGESLSKVLGGTRDRIPVGVSLGIQPKIDALMQRVDRSLEAGYGRIKLKVRHGWDLDVVAAVRKRHPDILLSVDANAAYTLADAKHLKQLDPFKLLMIEQPLPHDDLVDHATLQKQVSTDLCLDESINGLHAAEQALALGSCRIVNMKVGRVGGHSHMLAIHDLCRERGVPLWCGGMLESGIGRCHNVALASLPGFTLPGDVSASKRYFTRDLVDPPVELNPDGTVSVPQGPGLGHAVDQAYVEKCTVSTERVTRNAK